MRKSRRDSKAVRPLETVTRPKRSTILNESELGAALPEPRSDDRASDHSGEAVDNTLPSRLRPYQKACSPANALPQGCRAGVFLSAYCLFPATNERASFLRTTPYEDNLSLARLTG